MEEILIVSVCLILNALFSCYEMAFVSFSKSELKSLARTGHPLAQLLLPYREAPERALSIIQIGITLVGAIAAAAGGAGASDTLEPYFIAHFGFAEATAEVLAVVLVVVPIAFLSVVIGELVPKTLALRNPGRIVFAGAKWFLWSALILAPIVHILESTTKVILKVFFTKAKVAETDAQASIELSSYSPLHQKFILNMAEIEKKRVKEILLPWSQVNSVNKMFTVEEVAHAVLSSGHTRLPVTDGKSVIGILHTKEFMSLRESGEKNWQAIIRPALTVHLNDSALGVMRFMQEKHSHLVIVLSNNNELLGILTLEDIIEEVVGDIFDEDDDGRIRKIFAMRAKVKPAEFEE